MVARLRTAILGVGRMGRRHVRVAREAGLEVAGVFDISADSLRLTREEYPDLPESALFSDARTLLQATKPECVIVATTADSHCELACAAMEHGVRYVLCEKPMAVSLEQCDRMIRTASMSGARLAVNHQMRFLEQYTEPKRIARGEAFGGLGSVTVIAGNFGISMNCTHYFEMFRFLTDEPAEEVSAWFAPDLVPNPRGARFEDRAGAVRVTTASGRRLYCEFGADQGHGIRVVYAGRTGMIVVDELSGKMHLSVRRTEDRALPTTRYAMPSVDSEIAIRPFDVIAPSVAVLKALIAGENSVSAEHGRNAVEVLVAAYASSEAGGTPVRVRDGALPRPRVFPWA